MVTYSLSDLKLIFESKMYITKERFHHYLTHRYGYNEKDVRELFDIYHKFPSNIRGVSSENIESKLEVIIPIVLKIAKEIQDFSSDLGFKNIDYSEKDIKKIFYKDSSDNVKSVELDLLNRNDLLTFSSIVTNDSNELICLLKLSDYFNYKNSNSGHEDRFGSDYFHVYEGDVFTSYDDYFGKDKHNLYVAQKDGKFKPLMYIKGKGYLLNGKPNYDEDKNFNFHVLTFNKWERIGNIHVDVRFLSDNIIETTN